MSSTRRRDRASTRLHAASMPSVSSRPDLVVSPGAVMRGAGLPRGLQDVLAAEEQSGALRTADRLAAAVRDDRRAALEVDAGNGQDLGRRVDEDGNVPGLGDPGDGLQCHWPRTGPVVRHQIDHGRSRVERVLELLDRLDRDHRDAHVADSVVVHVP